MARNGSRMIFVNLPVKDLDRSVDCHLWEVIWMDPSAIETESSAVSTRV